MSFWARIPKTFAEDNWNRHKEAYVHPRDIEIFSGSLLEKRRVGEELWVLMFSMVNSLQFSRLKDGDRFFLTHTSGVAKMYCSSRQAIMAIKLSDIICNNTLVEKVHTLAFLVDHSCNNPLKKCGKPTLLNFDNINLIDV